MSIQTRATPADSPESTRQQLLAEAALHRVAKLVAAGAAETTIFDLVVTEATELLAPASIRIERTATTDIRDEPDGQLGIDADTDSVEVAIVVGGATWGVLVADSVSSDHFENWARTLLTDFAELASCAIAAQQARDELDAYTESRGALRRVATLVAQGALPEHVFDAIAVETSRVLGVGAVSLLSFDPTTETFTKIFGTHGSRSAVADRVPISKHDCPEGVLVLDTGRPVRIDDWSDIPGPVADRHREQGFGQCVAAPIILDGSVWGYIGAYGEASEALPAGCEMRLADFTHLMATAISSVQLRGLAESQGALRRVATLVAKGAEPEEVFAAVAVEASRILGVGAVSVMSYDAEAEIFTKIFGTHGDRACVPDGEPVLPEDCPEGTIILETGTPVRIDDWTHIPGPIAARHREQGFGQGIAAPIIINGSVWGHIGAYGEKDEVLPFGCEMRLADFTQLMASAIANAKARFELRALAERQGAALRRVATLVAQQSPAGLIYNAVAREASLALGVQRVDLGRCHKDGSITLLGTTRSDTTSSHREFSKVGEYVAHEVKETERPARIDDCTALPLPHAQAALKDGVHAAVGGPIRVDGALWGVIVAFSDEPVGDDIETRLSDFTHLVASSISNVHARNLLIASRSRIVAASDETRRRIERNLHDGIQQKLVALGLDLNTICDKSQLPESVQSALEGVARDLEDVVEEIRVFSNGLHPALLSRSGLGPSLRALARRSAMRVDVVVPVDLRFPEPIETAVYYVASEALANATKHAYASKVSITVAATSTELRTMVSDDGVGGATMGKGSGLIGLVDRVEALGGSLTLDSPLKHGTELTIVLPLGSPELSDPPAL